MFARASLLLLLSLSGLAVSANAETAVEIERNSGGGGAMIPYLQCVPYARQVSGIRIFGDAHTWWDQAEGHLSLIHI